MPKRVMRFQSVDGDLHGSEPTVDVILERFVVDDGHEIKEMIQPWSRIKLSDLFSPFELLDAAHVEEIAKKANTVPAANRNVPINHNSQAYRVADEALATLETALRETNETIEHEDREQRLAEVSALRKLLLAAKANIKLVVTFATSTLVAVGAAFKGKVIEGLASSAYEAVVALLGQYWPF
jgi:hypothetical protein